MAKLKDFKWTLVRHSAYVVTGDPTFKNAVELTMLTTEAEVEKVENAGGVLFDSYKEASDREFDENYPPSNGGLVPTTKGSFARAKLDGAAIYVPL